MTGKVIVLEAQPTATITPTPSDTPTVTATATATATPAPGLRCPGVDGNGVINSIDLRLTATHFGARQGDPSFDAKYDSSGDGIVNSLDLALTARQFGARCFQ